jgi:hypothetical protein
MRSFSLRSEELRPSSSVFYKNDQSDATASLKRSINAERNASAHCASLNTEKMHSRRYRYRYRPYGDIYIFKLNEATRVVHRGQ